MGGNQEYLDFPINCNKKEWAIIKAIKSVGVILLLEIALLFLHFCTYSDIRTNKIIPTEPATRISDVWAGTK